MFYAVVMLYIQYIISSHFKDIWVTHVQQLLYNIPFKLNAILNIIYIIEIWGTMLSFDEYIVFEFPSNLVAIQMKMK